MKSKATIGGRIWHARRELKMSRETLAYLCGCSHSAIAQIERDTFKPSRETAQSLSRALGESLDYILSGSRRKAQRR